MKIVAFFNLIRWKNLLLIALMQSLIKYFLLTGFDFQTILSNSLFYILVFTTIIISASGYVINDIIDLKVDTINKPNKVIVGNKISLINSKNIYFTLTILGVFSGTYLSFIIGKTYLSLYFISVSLLLFLYSKYLKGRILIGNILISLLLAFSILIVLLFDAPLPRNIKQINEVIKIQHVIIFYSIFAFLLNFVREIIKDIEDVNGDYNEGLKTFPIVLGRKMAHNFSISISVITFYLLIFVVVRFIEIKTIAFVYILLFVFIPLLYFIVQIWKSESKKQYTYLSNLLKIIILFGILSIPVISNYLKNVIN